MHLQDSHSKYHAFAGLSTKNGAFARFYLLFT
uniref:Uncharacterized protein n=1 Tax=Myoviridae sp. ctUPB15 TaxID=2825116 RepID=A0A8S5PU69_9CAUD|nr:MAG TPA: hypothetical protein [Myoviridae sp. ctUPB15]